MVTCGNARDSIGLYQNSISVFWFRVPWLAFWIRFLEIEISTRMGANANVTAQRTLSKGRGTFPSLDGDSLRSWSFGWRWWKENKSVSEGLSVSIKIEKQSHTHRKDTAHNFCRYMDRKTPAFPDVCCSFETVRPVVSRRPPRSPDCFVSGIVSNPVALAKVCVRFGTFFGKEEQVRLSL